MASYKMVVREENARPIKIWTDAVEDEALVQLKNLARLPFIAGNGVAVMPDVHAGKGSTVGSVIATDKAIIPAAVGVDIGCGMVAVRTSLIASQLPDNLQPLRLAIEGVVPVGARGHATYDNRLSTLKDPVGSRWFDAIQEASKGYHTSDSLLAKANSQVGSLGSGNHFIEICLDENNQVWVMLHSGSRGIGNMIGSYFIDKAKTLMQQFFITLPDGDLAFIPEDTDVFQDYVEALQWAQDYALENRRQMLAAVVDVLKQQIPVPFQLTEEAINCHHNYVARENHFGRNLWVTRKGAIRAREGDLGIIPGSMGQRSYIVRGKGMAESYCSCSHGAGRKMSRTVARQNFTVADLAAQTAGIECRKDAAVLDEIPGAYKSIDAVMEHQKDLVEVVHQLRQVLCIKGD